jgi:uncharacterized protein (DUF2141 family)
MRVKRRQFRMIGGAGLVLAFVAFAPAWQAYGAELKVTVDGVRNNAGKVRIAIFDRAAEFPRGKQVAAADLTAGKGRVVAVVQGLKPGRYAVAVLHDENNNHKMDFGFLGIPEEGYGFSNNARVIFGPPVFDAASFDVANGETDIVLNLNY